MKQKYKKLFSATLRGDKHEGCFDVAWHGFSTNISVTFQATLNPSAYFINHYLAVLCKFSLGDYWAFWERDIFFWKDGLNWGKYEMLKIWWIWKIGIWSEELVDGHQKVPYQPGALFWGVNCLVVFPTLLMLLQFSNVSRSTFESRVGAAKNTAIRLEVWWREAQRKWLSRLTTSPLDFALIRDYSASACASTAKNNSVKKTTWTCSQAILETEFFGNDDIPMISWFPFANFPQALNPIDWCSVDGKHLMRFQSEKPSNAATCARNWH